MSDLAYDYADPPQGLFVFETQTHFDDLDGLWMLHHARFLAFLERAQQALFDQAMETEAFDPQRYPDLYQVVRDIEIRYVESLRGVRPFVVLLKVARLRAAGLTTAFSFRSRDGQTLFAFGNRTVCKLGSDHQPANWTEDFRQRFGEWERAGRELTVDL